MDPYIYYAYYYTRHTYVNMYQDFIHPIRNPNEWMVPEEVQSKIMLAHNQKRKEEKEITQKKGTNSEMWIL